MGTIGELQNMIDNEHFIPVASQYLVSKNGILNGNSDSYLSDFGIEDSDDVELMLRINGGTKGQMRGKWKKKRMRRLRRRRRKMRRGETTNLNYIEDYYIKRTTSKL